MIKDPVILKMIATHRAKFNDQRDYQRIPGNTCPLIDGVQWNIYAAQKFLERAEKSDDDVRGLVSDAAYELSDSNYVLEEIREANDTLRNLGIAWYEICRDMLDDFEMQARMEPRPVAGFWSWLFTRLRAFT